MIRRVFNVLVLGLAMHCSAVAGPMRMEFRPVFGGDPLLLDSLRYENAAGERLSVTRLSGLLSGFSLQRTSGAWVEFPGTYAWIDLGQRRTIVELPAIPNGQFRAIRFHLGPDSVANHSAPDVWGADHPMNPNVNGLHWNWMGGYVFLAIEGSYRAGMGRIDGYSYHIAGDENRTAVTLAMEFSGTDAPQVQIDFDLRSLFNVPVPLSIARDGAATHSRPDDPVAGALVRNLQAAFRVRQVSAAIPVPDRPAVETKPRYMPSEYTAFRFKMGKNFPVPALPRDNPLMEERVELGRMLFAERALSRTGNLSCLACHNPGRAFSDGRQVSRGVEGRLGRRNANPIFNLAWKNMFFWDGRAGSLREQVLMPIQDHVEMDEKIENVARKLSAMDEYRRAFEAAFGDATIDAERISLALEQFLLTLTSYDSKFDRVMRGLESFSPTEQRGFELFMTEYEPRTGQYGADCFHCHGGALFTDHQLHNNGLQSRDLGRHEVTRREADRGKFITPSLRNIAVTAPYMHDGRFESLAAVMDHYSEGVQRTTALDPNLAKHPVEGLRLTTEDKQSLVAFLETLTDERFLRRARDLFRPE